MSYDTTTSGGISFTGRRLKESLPGPFNCRQPAAPLSLSYLHRFPFDEIKIDRSCINDIGQSETSSPIVQAVVLHQ